MDNWIEEVYYITMGVYRIPEHMGVRFRDDGMFIRNVLTRKEVLYVEHPMEEEIYKRIDRDRLLIVHGPKGDGLSIATIAALVKKILLDRAVVVDALAARDCLHDVVELREVVDAIREINREPVFYIDISKPGHYPRKPWEGVSYRPNKLEKFVETLKDVEAVLESEDVATVAVLSDDLYNVLRHELGEHTTVEVNSGDVYFLRELVQTYSGCGEDAAKEVAEAVAKHDGGRAVLAVLAADWLTQQRCGQEAIAEALKVAEEKAKELFINYIWHTVLNRDRPYANLHAPLILLRHFEGLVFVESAEDFLIGLGFPEHKVRGSLAVKWIASRHCRLIDNAIRKAVETALTKRIDEEPYEALRSALEYYYKHFKARGYFK
jgi:hypothetical protein